jgi:hypothetical protein
LNRAPELDKQSVRTTRTKSTAVSRLGSLAKQQVVLEAMPSYQKYKQSVNNIFDLIDRDQFDQLTDISKDLYVNEVDLSKLN